MASTKSSRHALASYDWINEERQLANGETLRHIDDFSYSVTHELEWLNEKMAEVFNGDPKTLTDIFKTPGKLRSKTPRTAKKANALTPRVPLGDVFTSHDVQTTPAITRTIKPSEPMPTFTIAEDSEHQDHYGKSVGRNKSPQRVGKPGNTDSGYHGMTEDEMEAELFQAVSVPPQSIVSKPIAEDVAHHSDASFASVQGQTVQKVAKAEQEVGAQLHNDAILTTDGNDDQDATSDGEVEDKTTTNRKSSFNFSSLPARQPFLSKKSLGPQHVEATSAANTGRAAAKIGDDDTAPKTTTQLLHERITMLGQPKAARPSKSIHYPELPAAQSTNELPGTQSQLARPATATSPARPVSTISMNSAYGDVTPSSSIKKQYDGPLSASKNRLMSVFKSARNIFASSASTSAAAKLEAHTSPRHPSPTREFSHESSILDMPGALRSDASLARSLSRPISVISASPSRKHRNSDEGERVKEKELKAQQKVAEELEKAREKERVKAAKEHEDRLKAEKAEIDRREKEALKQAEAAKPAATTGKLKSVGRPVRPVNAPKVPVPVNVKTTSQVQNDTSISRPGSTMRPSSAHSTAKSSTLGITKANTRALEAAARKKEIEEKDKLRRAQQKKELERKRVAKQAEEERKAVEVQRAAQEAKAAAQKQAAEDAKRREQQRAEQQRIEAQRQQEELQRQRAAQDLAEAIARERAQQQAQIQREATGTIRQLGQKVIDAGIRAIQTNPAKPAKRPLNAEDEHVTRVGPYQQNEGKRRKTDEVEENTRASMMAPPMRPSAIRKETLTRFPTGYTQVSNQPPATLFKTSQHHAQHIQRPAHPNQTVQMSNARIAFAESSKPATAVPSGHPEAQGKFKTPVRAMQANAKSAAKSSPMYPNGDNIALPEINTDSEEEDDDEEDNGFRAPSWVTSPALRDLLTQQQLVDPETVFGPIGELRMEEVFKNNKNPERLKKFRDRGSSAAWIQNGDAVTSAEKRRDMQMRERVAREGGWRYEPGL